MIIRLLPPLTFLSQYTEEQLMLRRGSLSWSSKKRSHRRPLRTLSSLEMRRELSSELVSREPKKMERGRPKK